MEYLVGLRVAIKYINYTKEQRRSSKVTGYSLYVNNCYCYIYDSMTEVKSMANKYARFNDVEIYPVLKRI